MSHRRLYDEVGEDVDLNCMLANEQDYAGVSVNEDDGNEYGQQSDAESSDSEEDTSRDWRGKRRRSSFNSHNRSPEQEASGEQTADLENIPNDKPIVLHVGNLHFEKVTVNTLRDVFSPYGKITKINIARDAAKGRSRGFGFVVFEDPDDAKRALKNLNKSMLVGRSLKVSIAKAAPKDLVNTQEDDNNSKKRPRDLRERLNQRNRKRPRTGDVLPQPVFGPPLAGQLGGLLDNRPTNNMRGLLDSPGHLDAGRILSRGGGGLLPHSAAMSGGLQRMPLKDSKKVIWEWQEDAMPSGASHMASLSRPTAGLIRNRTGSLGGNSGRMRLEEYHRRGYEGYEQRQFQQPGRQQVGVMDRGSERDMLRVRSRYHGRYDDPRQTQAPLLCEEDERALSSIKARAALAGSILRSLLPTDGEASQKPSSSSMMDDPPLHMPQTQQSPWAYPQQRRSGPLLEDPVIRSRLPEPQYPRAFSPPRLVQTVASDGPGMHSSFREQERHRSYSSGLHPAPVLNDPILQQMARSRAREQHTYAMPSGISSRW